MKYILPNLKHKISYKYLLHASFDEKQMWIGSGQGVWYDGYSTKDW